MSQHNMIIEDGSGEELLQATNSAVQALASDSLGTDWPPVPRQGQTAVKTATSPWLRGRYDGLDWIIEGTIDPVSNFSMPYFNGNPVTQLAPAGSITAFPFETPPAGWLECNGASLARSTYVDLFAAIGTTFGAADSTHFNLPDMRGRFPRGWDHGAGRDPDRASRADRGDGVAGDRVGTLQADQIKSHTHRDAFATSRATEGAFGTELSTDVGTTDHYVDNTGGNETRPLNINLMYSIKY